MAGPQAGGGLTVKEARGHVCSVAETPSEGKSGKHWEKS